MASSADTTHHAEPALNLGKTPSIPRRPGRYEETRALRVWLHRNIHNASPTQMEQDRSSAYFVHPIRLQPWKHIAPTTLW